jgi:uncharacterized membrane protein YgcG
MSFVSVLAAIGLYLFEILKIWSFNLFVAPFKNFDMLWVLIPIWLTWFFAEFFQEKAGTSLGNAISNAVTPFWGSLDWSRSSIRFFQEGIISTGSLIARVALCIVVFGYGITIIVLGIKGKKIIKYIGRIREVTYLVAMFTPVIYNVTPLSFNFFVAVIMFFPVFYFMIELIDYLTPDPEAVKLDTKEAGGSGKSKKDDFSSGGLGDLGSDSSLGGSDPFSSPQGGSSGSGSGSFGGPRPSSPPQNPFGGSPPSGNRGPGGGFGNI